jgi:predicted MFS family arabinose efflux permease
MTTSTTEEPPAKPTAPSSATPAGRLGTFDSLKIRDFRLLLVGTTLSNAAQWVQQVTLGWLVFDLTGSGAALGTMNLVRAIPTVGLAPLSGAIIDSVGRRTLMVLVNAWLLITTLVVGLVLVLGHAELWYLLVFTFLAGIAQSVDMPLRQTVVFVLVPRQAASNAVALIQTGWGLMRSIGPAMGGFLILVIGAGGNFLVQAVAYGLIAVNVLYIRFPPQPKPAHRPPVTSQMAEGLSFIRHSRVTRTFLFMGWVLPLLIVPVYITLPPIYAEEVFGDPDKSNAGILGLLLASAGVGGVFGGLVVASISSVDRRGLVQIAALFLTCLSLVLFALSTQLWLALLLVAASGFFEMIFLTTNQTLMQLSIPDELRGRVTSITSLSMGLGPVGAFVAGVGSDLIGPQEVTLVLCGLGCLVAVFVLLFVPTVRDYSMRAAIAHSQTQIR